MFQRPWFVAGLWMRLQGTLVGSCVVADGDVVAVVGDQRHCVVPLKPAAL